MPKYKPNRLQERAEEARIEGTQIQYKATDDDLPSSFWPKTEDEFWEQMLDALTTHI